MPRQILVDQARTGLNFQSPETVSAWYIRWSDELEVRDLEAIFGRWQARFSSLKSLEWLRYGGDPLYTVMYEIQFILAETPQCVHERERWQVPNKITHKQAA